MSTSDSDENHDFFSDYDQADDADADDMAALDFAPAGTEPPEGGIPAEIDDDEDSAAIPLFTVSNPDETVTVTTMMDGRVRHIELSPQASRMTESELAAEIIVIGKLAAQKAKAAQYSFLAHQMSEQGYDAVASQDFLTRELNLPTPADAAAAQATVFATRYAGSDD